MLQLPPKFDAFASALDRTIKTPRLIVFGSRLLGTQRHDSDVDVVILSEQFGGWGLYEREQMIAQAVADLQWTADVFTRTPAEWAGSDYLPRMVRSQLAEGDDWRRLIDALGRKISYCELLKVRQVGIMSMLGKS